ncbi:hypothetical protein SAMN05421810_11419 [Amycolatopsis arida]|uniref:ABC transporter n=1 Tax=Amycolatopsis arida TaxID=587909 RepID=A0A1I6AQZ0_9PSEU|nr:hypothetical protein [Amycolatopsis arida]TDX97604.1 hypothetical protein CLV69_102708 [Amycolatopsis arida]SFQ71062.1 hypothetical protein SAMN05421810_11419 [Amycolatopsis arida]
MAAAGAVAVSATGCGPDVPHPPAPDVVPHGYVEGAEETAEAQPRLVVADRETGTVRVVDLITERVSDVGRVSDVRGIHGDGRFAYLAEGTGTVRVVDGGAWTVDHVDHVHYYRAAIREVGTVPGGRPVSVHSDSALTAVSGADGTVHLLDRARLEAGTVARTGTISLPPGGGGAVPWREHLLVPAAPPGQPAGTVEVRDRRGHPVSTVEPACPSPRGTAVTRRGVVFGCADGALLVTERDGAFHGEKIPYPRPVPEAERAVEFAHRPAGTTLAAKAGERGVWSLDLTRGTWTFLETGPAVAVNAVGEGAPLLALTADGVLHAYDTATGERTAHRPVLAAPVDESDPALPVIHVDPARAYVNDVAAGIIHEIDYTDRLRQARTFHVGGRASHMVETGR